MKHQWPAILQSFLMLLISIIGFFIIRSFNSVDESIKIATTSVNSLNIKMAEVLTKQHMHDQEIRTNTTEIKELQRVMFRK